MSYSAVISNVCERSFPVCNKNCWFQNQRFSVALIDELFSLRVFPWRSAILFLCCRRDYFAALDRWRALAGPAAGPATLIYAGGERQKRAAATVLPWQAVDELAVTI